MENQKNDNLNLLEAVVQNTEMGKNTLEQILPMTNDVQFKAELLRQRNIYHQLNQEAHTAIEACGGSAQGQSTMAKLNTKMGIGLKTLTDKSTRNLAEMLTQGSGMGVVAVSYTHLVVGFEVDLAAVLQKLAVSDQLARIGKAVLVRGVVLAPRIAEVDIDAACLLYTSRCV